MNRSTTTDEVHLDASDLVCPMPVLRARKALQTMPAGAVLVLTTTDPRAVEDVPAFCRQVGHEMLDLQSRERHSVFRIRRGS